MAKIVVMNHVTVDGVIQGPARADEDTQGGFTQGGWARRATGLDGPFGKAMGERMAAGGGLAGWIFGRRTYEGVLGHWTQQPDSPFGQMLSDAAKYVASTTLTEPLPWPNSTLLRGDIAEAVRAVKARTAGVLGIMGSGELIGALLAAGLIDEYVLAIHPLVLGGGKRLFPEQVAAPLRLVSSVATEDGVLIATYAAATDEGR